MEHDTFCIQDSETTCAHSRSNSRPAAGLSVELGEKGSSGVEFDVRGSIFSGLNLVANYAYTDSRVTKVADGIPILRTMDIVLGYAKHTANALPSPAIE